ncbi:hypothetical protein ERJ75_001237100 [Trypanosoma vivax]|nr:hypothetical protein TRVL_00001 [Trypanosoma vivax]KAH8608949.1 hypothetical protein ERJ75_001237100 [Trypanosoma vivax]
MFRTRLHRGDLCAAAIGYTFMVDFLYGSRYAPHIGSCSSPYAYVSTILSCTSNNKCTDTQKRQREYICGLVEHLVTATTEEGKQSKLGLLRLVNAMPTCSDHTSLSDRGGGDGGSNRCGPGGRGLQTSEFKSTKNTSPLPAALSHILLYDAMYVCMENGEYIPAARENVERVAARLGVSHRAREVIENVVRREQNVAERKRRLLLLSNTSRTD